MRKFVFSMFATAMMMLLTACPGNNSVETIDLGAFPEQYTATVPYADGDIFRMQHENSKLIIEFTVYRYRYSQMWFGYGIEKFSLAPSCYYYYEEDITTCSPNYPLFEISIRMSNLYMAEKVDSYGKRACISTIVGSALVPFIGDDLSGYTVTDSLEINGKVYRDVLKLDAGNYYLEDDDCLHVTNFLYSYGKGVVGIIMSNGEKYMIYED